MLQHSYYFGQIVYFYIVLPFFDCLSIVNAKVNNFKVNQEFTNKKSRSRKQVRLMVLIASFKYHKYKSQESRKIKINFRLEFLLDMVHTRLPGTSFDILLESE